MADRDKLCHKCKICLVNSSILAVKLPAGFFVVSRSEVVSGRASSISAEGRVSLLLASVSTASKNPSIEGERAREP